MKRLVLAVTAMIMLTLPGWGEGTPREQAKAGAAAHREEARNNPNRPHQPTQATSSPSPRRRLICGTCYSPDPLGAS